MKPSMFLLVANAALVLVAGIVFEDLDWAIIMLAILVVFDIGFLEPLRTDKAWRFARMGALAAYKLAPLWRR